MRRRVLAFLAATAFAVGGTFTVSATPALAHHACTTDLPCTHPCMTKPIYFCVE